MWTCRKAAYEINCVFACVINNVFACVINSVFACVINSVFACVINPLNAELNPIRHLLALVGGRHIVHVSRIRVNNVFTCVINRT